MVPGGLFVSSLVLENRAGFGPAGWFVRGNTTTQKGEDATATFPVSRLNLPFLA
jgi:hypothetical protein